jgi:hypothetical protein
MKISFYVVLSSDNETFLYDSMNLYNVELFRDKNIINVEDLDKRREMDRLKR